MNGLCLLWFGDWQSVCEEGGSGEPPESDIQRIKFGSAQKVAGFFMNITKYSFIGSRYPYQWR
jgi:hypothetical protein